MRLPFLALSALILMTSFLLTSCATLISGSKQGVRINTNVPEAVLLIDDEMEVQSGETVKLSRKKRHALEVAMEGYEKVEYDFTRRINPLVWGNMVLFPVAMLTGIVLASQKTTYIDNSIPGDPIEYEEYKEPQFTIGLLTASFSWLIPAIPFGVDALTGAMYRIDKEVNVELYKLPAPFNPDEVITTQVNRVNIKIDPGTKIGGMHNKRGTVFSDINWEQSVNVSFEDLQVQANNDMNDLGLNIPGLRNLNEEMPQSGRESYLIEAEIKRLDYDIYMETISSYHTDCELETTWRVLHPKTKKIEYFTTIKSKGSAQADGGATPVYRALRHSIYSLGMDPAFRELMKKDGSTPIAANQEGEGSGSSGVALSSNSREKLYGISEIAAEHKDAVVTILNNAGHGSGFVVTEDGYIMTNAHVVDGFNDLKVKFANGFSFTPEVVSIDVDVDVALLKVPGDGYPYLTMTTTQPDLGEEILVIGTPAQEDLSQSVSRGVVSGIRLIDGRKMIQTDAGISPGNSGGPMFDMYGQVVGIVTSKIIGGGVEGIGFGIPSSEVIKSLGVTFR
ncbi:MAG: trypsin-like peptidase domain-containing protein [Flavobacteriales bacterium]|nr:trypsin-like peptidase domain-containing protein [Flavobacteriales bacterium]